MSENNSNIWGVALAFFAKISAWVAVPIIGALFLGRYLDSRFQTKPWIFLGLTGIAFIISLIGILKESREYLRDIEVKAKQDEYAKRTTDKQ